MEATVKTAGNVVGFVDIGTNAVRLLVVRINPNFSYTIISQEKEVIRLGEEEFKDKLLKPEAMERAIFVCGKFVDLAKTYGATEYHSRWNLSYSRSAKSIRFPPKTLERNWTQCSCDFWRGRSSPNLSGRVKWN